MIVVYDKVLENQYFVFWVMWFDNFSKHCCKTGSQHFTSCTHVCHVKQCSLACKQWDVLIQWNARFVVKWFGMPSMQQYYFCLTSQLLGLHRLSLLKGQYSTILVCLSVAAVCCFEPWNFFFFSWEPLLVYIHTYSYNPLDFVWDYPGELVPKPIWILLKQETVSGSDISWGICKSAPRPRQITMPALHHSVLTGQMPFWMTKCFITEVVTVI